MTEAQIADYVIVGGGTAGCIVANRLSEDPSVSVLLLEWGPSDKDEERAHSIRRWPELVDTDYDLSYPSVENKRGNSNIRQTRMRLLGGCSTVNTMIAWKPLPSDLDEWVALGAEGWDPETLEPYYDKLTRISPINLIPPQDQNPYLHDVFAAATQALDIPLRTSWNDNQELVEGAGFFEIGYTPENNFRSSSSLTYIHPFAEDRPNLHIELERQGLRLLLENGRCVGVLARNSDGLTYEYRANREVIVSCGAIDSPKLLQLSGIGPAEVLAQTGVPQLVDLPGVGESLQDHAEGIVIWETATQIDTSICATSWDGGYVVKVDEDSAGPDVSTHAPLSTEGALVELAGWELPERTVSLAANIAKPKSTGRVWITSTDPDVPASIDYNSFSDPDGHDERMLIAGVRNARRVAEQEPFKQHLVREVFPGPGYQTDAEISEVERRAHGTVFHVSCTCKMGADDDPLAVLDPRLRVRGVSGLRVVDASSFPTVTGLNPCTTVMVLAERAADLIKEDAATP